MGDPKKPKKKYASPKKMWAVSRVMGDRMLAKKYGLKKKEEIWRASTKLSGKRKTARKLLALELDQRIKMEKELTDSLYSQGLLERGATLEDVLGLKVESLLDRRLGTILCKKGMTTTQKQARQLITHGHIKVNGRKVTAPSYLVKRDEENTVDFMKKELEAKLRPAVKAKPVQAPSPQEAAPKEVKEVEKNV